MAKVGSALVFVQVYKSGQIADLSSKDLESLKGFVAKAKLKGGHSDTKFFEARVRNDHSGKTDIHKFKVTIKSGGSYTVTENNGRTSDKSTSLSKYFSTILNGK
ncbi:hypothetical protein [Parashewanella tropica]|uniref:hypothetical protein n=1 Tax=Parashewanella tropica TaxID=2547970 RepID=UPI001059F844|nr:hypothetical protein [Parashewanella tropica]